jgi:hypothetical protein
MGPNNNTVLLRVQLSEEDTEKRLQQLVLDIEATKKAQAALTLARKADKISEDEYAKSVVDLRAQLRGQVQEQTAQTKNLELYRAAVNGVAGSYDQVQAQLTLAQRQYRGLADSADDSTEATQALSAVVRDLRGQLKETDASSLDQFFRSVGDYPKPQSLEPLIQQIVKLEELQKAGILTAQQLAEADRAAIGYRQQYAQAAAAQGKTLDQATNELKAYGDAVRPTVAQLVKLENEQNKVATSAGKEGAAYAEIGFKIGAARKELAALPPATELAASSSEKTSKKLGEIGDTIENLDDKTGAFGGTVGELKSKFEQAKAGVEAAKVGFSGLKGAIAATGIGLFLLALGALYSYLTRTQEGLDFVERKTKGVATIIGVLTDKASAVGEVLFNAFDHPKQALSDLADFLGTNLLNRLTSLKVIAEGIINLDPRKFADGFIQAGTGIADATAKGQNLVTELGNAAKAGEAIAAENQRIRDSERAVNLERAQSKKDIEALKLIAEDVTKSTVERAAATQKAAALEQSSINKQLQLQRDRIANIEREQRLTNTLTEGNDKLVEEKQKLAELEEGSLTRQIELNNKLNELRKAGLDRALADNKAYYERLAVEAVKGSEAELNAKVKVLEADRATQLAAVGLTENQRRLIVANSEQAIKQLRRDFAYTTLQQVSQLEQLALDRRILATKAGSEEELQLQREKLTVQRDTELAAVGLTVRQVKAIREKYLADVSKLEQDARRAQAVAMYEARLAEVNTELVAIKKGTDEETALRREAIDTQLSKELAALDQRKDNAAAESLLRANAAKAINDVNYSAALAKLDRFLSDQRLAIEEQNARGVLTEKAYNKALLTADSIAAGSRLQLAKDYHQETVAQENAAKTAQIAILKQLTEEEKAEIQKRIATAQTFGEQVGGLIAESLFEQGATIQEFLGKLLILALDVVEKQLIAQQVASIGSAAIQSMSEPDSVATFGASGFARIAILTAAITAAFEIAKAGISAVTAPPKQFAQGTVLSGASHAQGGVQLYSRSGQHFGEAEGGEAVINKRSTALFLPVLSAINELGGGRSLVSGVPTFPRMALGGISAPLAAQQLRGDAPLVIDYNRLVRAFEKVNLSVGISDISAANKRKAFTDSMANGFGKRG